MRKIITALATLTITVITLCGFIINHNSTETNANHASCDNESLRTSDLRCHDVTSTRNVWVDLGLPSGAKWKSVNETNPNDPHDFYTFHEAANEFGERMPTRSQWKELKEECSWTWTGSGYLVTGPNSHNIFLPAAGVRLNGLVGWVGDFGYYWSSNYYTNSNDAVIFYFCKEELFTVSQSQSSGLSVRLVID